MGVGERSCGYLRPCAPRSQKCKIHLELTILAKETVMPADLYISASLCMITELQMKWERSTKEGMVVSVYEGRKYSQE